MSDKNLTPSGNAPNWIDTVLGETVLNDTSSQPAQTPASSPSASQPLSGPADLKLPESPVPGPSVTPSAPAAQDNWSADEWVAGITGGTPERPRQFQPQPQPHVQPQAPQRPYAEPPTHRTDAWGDPVPLDPQPYAHTGYMSRENVSQKKMMAGLLAIFLGSFGVHKFYLGLNKPGFILLGVSLGIWPVAIVLGLMMFVVGLKLTLPFASLVTSALALLGLVEGIIYLTRTDADFERDYLIDKKPWL